MGRAAPKPRESHNGVVQGVARLPAPMVRLAMLVVGTISAKTPGYLFLSPRRRIYRQRNVRHSPLLQATFALAGRAWLHPQPTLFGTALGALLYFFFGRIRPIAPGSTLAWSLERPHLPCEKVTRYPGCLLFQCAEGGLTD